MNPSRKSSWLSLPDVDEEIVMEPSRCGLQHGLSGCSVPSSSSRRSDDADVVPQTSVDASTEEVVAPAGPCRPKRSSSWMSTEDVDEANVTAAGDPLQPLQKEPRCVRDSLPRRSSSWMSTPDVDEVNVAPCSASGPVSLAEVLQTQHLNVKKLVAKLRHTGDESSLDVLRSWCQDGITVTSSYSGMGTFEAVVVQVMSTLAETLSLSPPQIRVYSSTELSDMARRLLASHEGVSAPEHIFTDVLDRLPSLVRTALEQHQREVLEHFCSVRQEHQAGKIGDDEFHEVKTKMTKDYVNFLLHNLHGCKFAASAYCHQHLCQCALSPRSEGAAGDVGGSCRCDL